MMEVRTLSGRWDWWNEGKDTTKKLESWQPLTEEERRRVVVVPVARRLRLNPEAWRGSRNVDPGALAESARAARAREAEELKERAKRSAATVTSNKGQVSGVAVKIEVKDVKVRKSTDSQGGVTKTMGRLRYAREDILDALNVMVDFFGKMPSTTQIIDYASKNDGVLSMTIFAKHLGPKDTWQAQLDEYVASLAGAGEPNGAAEGPEVSNNGPQGQVLSVPGGAADEPASLAEVGSDVAGDERQGTGSMDDAKLGVAEKQMVNPDELTEVDPDLLLSIATSFRVRMYGKEYTFVAQFEDLRPVAVENIQEEDETE